MNGRSALLVSAAFGLLVACAPPPDSAVDVDAAAALQAYRPELPDDMEVQARQVLEEDAWRRQDRFLEAVAPGRGFAATRVDPAALADRRVTPAQTYALGAQLFNTTFTPEEGFGGRDLPTIRRFQVGDRGGPDAYACVNCHWRGGPAGAGDGADDAYIGGDGEHQSTALARNPRALVGAGVVERLAVEMTTDLARQRSALLAAAKRQGQTLRTELTTKGVSFGHLSAGPDGTIYAVELEGIDADLVVRPFGWKGTAADLRDMVEHELATHHGMQSRWLVHHDGPERLGAAGGDDPDGDGVVDEITEGQVSVLTAFVAMQEVPIQVTPERSDIVPMLAQGRADFLRLGCGGCHTPDLVLDDATWRLPGRDGAGALAVSLTDQGGEPRLAPSPEDGRLHVFLYSDLKRHHMGATLAEARPTAGPVGLLDGDVFVTPPLWGVARSRPYLHDASAPTLEDAILAHGGEAQAARDAFAGLSDRERFPVRLFLTTLTRATRLVTP